MEAGVSLGLPHGAGDNDIVNPRLPYLVSFRARKRLLEIDINYICS